MDKYYLTPAEKLDAIHSLLTDTESRRKRAVWYRAIKWAIILGLAYIAITQPGLVVEKITKYMQPIIMEQMKTIIENQKESIIQQAKEMMSDGMKQQ